jgi:hypothetical protein
MEPIGERTQKIAFSLLPVSPAERAGGQMSSPPTPVL